jgi:hypothetical protein
MTGPCPHGDQVAAPGNLLPPSSQDLIRAPPQPPESAGITGSSPAMTTGGMPSPRNNSPTIALSSCLGAWPGQPRLCLIWQDTTWVVRLIPGSRPSPPGHEPPDHALACHFQPLSGATVLCPVGLTIENQAHPRPTDDIDGTQDIERIISFTDVFVGRRIVAVVKLRRHACDDRMLQNSPGQGAGRRLYARLFWNAGDHWPPCGGPGRMHRGPLE